MSHEEFARRLMEIDPSKLFETEDGEQHLSELGLGLIEAFDAAIENRVAGMVRVIVEQIMDHLKRTDEDSEQAIADSEEEVRKLMLLAVSELGGPEAATSFIRKVATLARSGALSAASGDWAAGAPGKAASNLQSLTPGSRPSNEECAAEEADVALEVFHEVTAGMLAPQVEQMRSLCEDIEFEGDVADLRERVTTVREIAFPQANPYVAAISRTVRRS